jgi:hypothetical protein
LRCSVRIEERLPVADVAERFSEMGRGVFVFRKWNTKPSEDDLSLLEQALKKCGWRGPRQPWAQREDDVLHR